jgi:hypothetical protein
LVDTIYIRVDIVHTQGNIYGKIRIYTDGPLKDLLEELSMEKLVVTSESNYAMEVRIIYAAAVSMKVRSENESVTSLIGTLILRSSRGDGRSLGGASDKVMKSL